MTVNGKKYIVQYYDTVWTLTPRNYEKMKRLLKGMGIEESIAAVLDDLGVKFGVIDHSEIGDTDIDADARGQL